LTCHVYFSQFSQRSSRSANQFGVVSQSHQHSRKWRYYIGQILCIHHSNWSPFHPCPPLHFNEIMIFGIFSVSKSATHILLMYLLKRPLQFEPCVHHNMCCLCEREKGLVRDQFEWWMHNIEDFIFLVCFK
jgi:hypothetical protein